MTKPYFLFSVLGAVFLCVCAAPQLSAQYSMDLNYSRDLIKKNKIDSAILILNAGIKKSANATEKGLAYLQLGSTYKQEQQYARALAAYRSALQLFKTQKATPGIFLTYTGIAELYRYQRLYRDAEEYLKLCEDLLKREKIPDAYLMKFYSRKAALFSEYHQKPDSALIYSEKAMILAHKTEDRDVLMQSLMEISGIYVRKHDYAQAIKLSAEVVALAQKDGNVQLQCDALVNLCRNLNLNEEYSKSIRTSLEAFEFAKKNKKTFNQLLFADNLQVAYSKINDYRNAHKYLRIRLDLTEDFYNKLHDQKVLEYEKKFRLAEKQNQIDDNHKLLLLKEEELKRQELIRYFILLMMLAAVLLTGVLLYNTRLIRKKNTALRLASEENELLVSETHHRINNNLQLISILIQNELKKNPALDAFSRRRITANIDSLGVLHRHLYQNATGKSLDLHAYLKDIWENAEVLFEANGITNRFEVAHTVLPEMQAMYFGLLVTELCMNSLKHAFTQENHKNIALLITSTDNGLSFCYTDNGKGTAEIPKLQLVDKLCRQLRVQYQLDTTNGFQINFDMNI
ncbi:histidine kinase dimerization/phosphoacceptor domain -containing protein [Chryseobacterium salivictor]|uniref:histidine kinase n=1 Tax=Chryseobacterium salivictor TaxID=2547600 RepID=A0A4P6ZGH5_9FLAO|nr:histidine kinase dimerization/phosphoacceptor domain -containing protein [Chryseobacterium salivictor]QBO58763.1 hypothetical protein NBC122_01955 [Chryseobacterium salivictor]